MAKCSDKAGPLETRLSAARALVHGGLFVGAGLAEDSGAIARAIHAIGDVHLHMLSLDSSGINLTIVIDAAAMQPVMQRLHDAFFAEAA